LIDDLQAQGKPGVLACSALKRRYRDFLKAECDEVRFVFLKGDFDQISARLRRRKDHFMNASLLQSQFDHLEVPGEEEAIVIDTAKGVEQITDQILAELQGWL
jgi:gluconokinase